MAFYKSGMKLADEAKATPTPNMRRAEEPRPQPYNMMKHLYLHLARRRPITPTPIAPRAQTIRSIEPVC